jgi:hypothetical protein
MQARLTTKPVQEVISAIQALDLESVKIRVMDAELGEGWTREYAESIEIAYKTYLTMVAKYQEHAEDILLSKDVDEFWHTHILQTMKYADDCQEVFGTFLHHDPHIGERTPALLEKRAALARKTRELYEHEFGDAQHADSAWSGGATAMSNVAIRAHDAAMSNIAIRSDDAAMSNVAIRAAQAAMSNVAIRAHDAAMSNIAIRSDDAAMSNVAIRAAQAAMSNVAIRADNAAMSNIAIRSDDAAMSNAAIRAENAAMSNVAIRADNAAMSNIGFRSEAGRTHYASRVNLSTLDAA